ncbi:hypothetical protein VTP01DRAFT_1392 [Rhizomucor pusillus]|uniref:uncharacterized protein n=1 Tax=Rhizomucor pusillus TaxID=4840 RepID=UPI003743D7C3
MIYARYAPRSNHYGIKFNRLTTAYTINPARHLSTTAYLHRNDATNSVDLRLGPPVQIQATLKASAANRSWLPISQQNRKTIEIKHLSQQQHQQPVTAVASQKERLVILGSGWAGFKLLREVDRSKYKVTIVSPRNYFVFTPLLASTSVGTIEFRCITEPIRRHADRSEFYQARCERIAKGNEFSLSYDKLVIAVGAHCSTFGIPGVTEYAQFLKDVQDAQAIRKRLIECYENASQPGLSEQEIQAKLHFVVVGGGPTGIEFSGELYDFLSNDMARLYPELVAKTRMSLYDVAPQILGSFDSQLSLYAHKKFDRKGIQIKTKRHVERVEPDHIVLRGEGKVPYGLLVWSTGLTQNPFVKSITALAKDPKNQRIITDNKLRVLTSQSETPIPNVYALGDCATILSHDLPATAQVATQKAAYLARMLNQGEHKQEFMFRNRGTMAYIGSSEALVDMSSIHRKAKNSGHLAWLLWRSAYLSMSMSMRNKMLILYHWFMTWSFGRDITRF